MMRLSKNGNVDYCKWYRITKIIGAYYEWITFNKKNTCDFIYFGKRKGNKIAYTKYKRMPYHSYYESYSVGDYLVENDYKKTVKFKKLSNGKIEMDGYYTFSKSDEY